MILQSHEALRPVCLATLCGWHTMKIVTGSGMVSWAQKWGEYRTPCWEFKNKL